MVGRTQLAALLLAVALTAVAALLTAGPWARARLADEGAPRPFKGWGGTRVPAQKGASEGAEGEEAGEGGPPGRVGAGKDPPGGGAETPLPGNIPGIGEPFPASDFLLQQAAAFRTRQAAAEKDLRTVLLALRSRTPPPEPALSAALARSYLHIKCMCYTGLGNRIPGIVAGFGLALVAGRVAVLDYPLGGCQGAGRWWEHDAIEWEWPRRGNCSANEEGAGVEELDPAAAAADGPFEPDAEGEPPVPETLGQLVLLITSGRLPPLLRKLFPAEHPNLPAADPPPRRPRSCPPVPRNMDSWIFHDDNHLPSHALPLLRSNLTLCHPERLWRLYTGDYLLPLLDANPHYAPWFRSAFPRGDAFFQLARQFWRPATRLREEAGRFAKEEFGLRTVGMHVRTLKNRETAPRMEVFLDAALTVARQMGVLPADLLPSAHSDAPKASKPARAAARPELRLFLATDTPNATIPAHLLPYVVTHTPPSSLAVLNPQDNPSTDDEAMSDLLLLGLSDAVVTTFGSSFGNVAASLAGLVPYVAMHAGTGGLLTVSRAWTAEPCVFHSSAFLGWARDGEPGIEYPPWWNGTEGERRKEEGWAREVGRRWGGYYAHRAVGECHW